MKNIPMRIRELEFKYKADNITVGQFMDFVDTNFDIIDIVTARGTDYFYSAGEGEFIRYRVGGGWNDNCEITVKRKTTESNSWNRVEVDLPLNKNKADKDTVDHFLGMLGHEPMFSLTKLNYVVRTPGLTLAYYVVNGSDRFLEIEANKGAFASEDEAFDMLGRAEKKLSALGLTHNNRTRLSLFEMYK